MTRIRHRTRVLAAVAVLLATGIGSVDAAEPAAGTKSFSFEFDLGAVGPDDWFLLAVDDDGNPVVRIGAAMATKPVDGCVTVSIQPAATCVGPVGLFRNPHLTRVLGAVGPVASLFGPGGAHTIVAWSSGGESRIDCSWGAPGGGIGLVVTGGCVADFGGTSLGSGGTLIGIQDVCWSCATPQQNGVLFHHYAEVPD